MKRLVIAALAAAIPALPGAAQEGLRGTGLSASADMRSPDGSSLGTVTFNQTPSGYLHLIVEMQGLPPGPHGFHVHETGSCEDDFKSAGGHYAGGKDHGVQAQNGPHAGDFPNVHVGQDGILKVEFFTERLSLDEGGQNPLMDADGSAVVIHGKQDDYASQPSGEAGDRIACGVVVQPG